MLRPRIPDPVAYQHAGTRLVALFVDLAAIVVLVYGVTVWGEDLSANAPALAATGLAIITDTWELAALTTAPSQVRRAWAPFLYIVDGAAFILTVLALAFIFWTSAWGTYMHQDRVFPYSWNAKQTITWTLLSAVGILRFFFVVLSCTDHYRMRRATTEVIQRIRIEASSASIGRQIRSTRPPEVSWHGGGVSLDVLQPAGKTVATAKRWQFDEP